MIGVFWYDFDKLHYLPIDFNRSIVFLAFQRKINMGKYFLAIPKTLVFVLLLTCVYQVGFGQMQVEEAIPPSLYNPINLIENVFLGDGVEVTAINYDGNNNAVGFFKDGISQVGMERGIVMSTGFAGSADDPNDSPNTSGMTSGSSLSDPDLAALTTVGLRDISKNKRHLSTFALSISPIRK